MQNHDLAEIKEWMTDLKNRGIGIVISASTPLKSRRLYWLFDNVIEIGKWRQHRCSERNLTAKVCILDKVIQKTPFSQRLVSPAKSISWEEKPSKYNNLRFEISYAVAAGLTAKEIVQKLQEQHKTLSLPMLAKLKREWGIKSYKRHNHSKRQKSEQSPSL